MSEHSHAAVPPISVKPPLPSVSVGFDPSVSELLAV